MVCVFSDALHSSSPSVYFLLSLLVLHMTFFPFTIHSHNVTHRGNKAWPRKKQTKQKLPLLKIKSNKVL